MLKWLSHQWSLLITATIFLSRLPLRTDYHADKLSQSSRYFPLAGLCIGVLIALAFYLFNGLFSHSLALALCMVFSLLLTGAFHEDGLADSCDALWGSHEKAGVLRIMKDSRLGTYGVAGLVSALAIKFAALNDLSASHVMAGLICAHATSRGLAISFLYDMQYVQDEDVSKSKPIAQGLSKKDLGIALAFAITPCVIYLQFYALPLLAGLTLLRQLGKHYLIRRIDGYTGDTLGAAQQLFEISIYLYLCAVL